MLSFMKVLTLTKSNTENLIAEAIKVLQSGGSVVYPTDTSYGLGCDALNSNAIKKLYLIKERPLRKKPMHILIPSLNWAKKYVSWNKSAQTLADAFLPGPLSLALPLKTTNTPLSTISPEGFLGLRLPKNSFALQLVQTYKKPITATSANPSAVISKGYDPYSADDVIKQFKNKKNKPDLIIDAGQLKKNKPSTFVRFSNNFTIEILRTGPISEEQIYKALQKK
ncbi:MAG: translation factor [Candidatus Doudnabacteria bacterium]|nr:translation factor [Candidatus Doudnabacteria bacterium]